MLGILTQAPVPAPDAPGIDPTFTLIVALISMLGVTIAPIVVAMINKGTKAAPPATPPPPDPQHAIKRSEYDHLLEQIARLDDECDRLTRENNRLRRKYES